MLTGLVAGGHVHLTEVAQGQRHRGAANIHAAQKLSRHLASEHWNAGPLAAKSYSAAQPRWSPTTR